MKHRSDNTTTSAELRHNQLAGVGYTINIQEPTKAQYQLMVNTIESVRNNPNAMARDIGRAKHLQCALNDAATWHKAAMKAHKHRSAQALARCLYNYHGALFQAYAEYTRLTELVIF